MKYHPIFKGLALLLAAASLLLCFAGAAGILVLSGTGLDTGDFESWQYDRMRDQTRGMAQNLLDRYLARELGGCSESVLNYLGLSFTAGQLLEDWDIQPMSWTYEILDEEGRSVCRGAAPAAPDAVTFSYTVSSSYPVDVSGEQVALYDDTGSTWRDYFIGDGTEHYLYYYNTPAYTVTLSFAETAAVGYGPLSADQVRLIFSYRHLPLVVLGVGLALFLLCFVYLCFAAGRSSDGKTRRPGGLNRMPLDLYLLLATAAAFAGAYLGLALGEQSFNLQPDVYAYSLGGLVLSGGLLLFAALSALCFLYACVAQFKAGNGYWWKHTLIGRVLYLLYRAARKLLRLLPIIWRWLLTAAAMVLLPLFCLLLAMGSYGFLEFFFAMAFFLLALCDIAMVCYGAYAFGTLLKGARAMSQGDLNQKIPTRYLYGDFRLLADHLNTLSDAAVIAAREQMKSERMKTELITNVSHDIKTPLTSIVNFVDLLQKPHTEAEGTEYLAVLDRQSQRLKKLIDDLMEMSKASTGNMAVNAGSLDMAETVNQALGEFADKLAQADLTVVFPVPTEPVKILADGRLTWRVLSNLLSNTVKYALPGTRVYLDISQYGGNVLLSIKNISRESLNVDAQELTERFVRGDASRNTEGSGLGLNIAKSLMELQKGRLNLLIDGDLFKVTLTFPQPQ